MLRHSFVLLGGVFLLSGCSVFDLERKVSKLERSMSDLRALQAEQAESLSSLDSQIKLIAGRMEELEFSQTRRMGSDLSALKDDLSALRKRIPPPPGVPTAELESDESWASNLPDEAKRTFLDGLSMLREGKFADSVPLFENVAEQTRSTDKAGAALFWLGVAHDGALDNRAALRAYAETVSLHPKSHRAPASLARQAEVFVRLGDNKTAQLSLQKLIEDYPKSPEAVEAKSRIKQLK
ncbi:MAG: tetratricopeptide repeat protein [Pseudomonadota bacterium]|jgi:TolA-binding protein